MSSSPNLNGKTIFIAGACGRIGSATAKSCLEAGGKVILADINSQYLHNLETSFSKKYPSKVCSTLIDITDSSSLDEHLLHLGRSFGTINSAVHCAYPTSSRWGASFEALDSKHLFEDLSLQLGGAILFSRSLIQYFLKFDGGSLVHLSSIQGIMAPKFEHYIGTSMSSPIEYAAIKAGIIHSTRWLAKYYTNKNIRVNCVSPGGILDNQDSSFLEKYRKSCNNIGMLESSHVSDSIAFLLSDSASAITGQNIVIDDGWSL